MNDSCGYFVTGTDTGVGKTTVTLGLMQALQQQGRTAGLRNEDALQLQQQASVVLAYDQINPYAYAPAIAPHIAAEALGVVIEVERIYSIFNEISESVDCMLVEGAGGWLVPLTADETLAELAVELGLGVVLVVGLRLGCLNHALLTAAAVRASGCRLAGWVANQLPGGMDAVDGNIHALQARLGCPMLGTVPVLPEISAKTVADHLVIGTAGNT
jgi:dethiobiotin synthetase